MYGNIEKKIDGYALKYPFLTAELLAKVHAMCGTFIEAYDKIEYNRATGRQATAWFNNIVASREGSKPASAPRVYQPRRKRRFINRCHKLYQRFRLCRDHFLFSRELFDHCFSSAKKKLIVAEGDAKAGEAAGDLQSEAANQPAPPANDPFQAQKTNARIILCIGGLMLFVGMPRIKLVSDWHLIFVSMDPTNPYYKLLSEFVKS